jgi:phosphoribosylformylglycinamidine synthase subunit PurL
MSQEPISQMELQQHGLTQDEWDRIKHLLGREPNRLELGMFSVMWSEHCSYKSSKVYLKNFPTTGKYVIEGPGENAGVIDIGDGWVAVFKIESHNHPSYIEPYQGAATGIGGILRDIFTMGARPVALLNSLRFGPLSIPKNRFLFEGVVAGIAGYGNCVGVPTVGGEIYFHEIYNRNPLVNAFCLGIAKREDIVKGLARGAGNAVIYVGSKTGRDGIHGATMASESFDEKAESRRPAVQVGDPFTGKLLLEACQEIAQLRLAEGIQDMGAAGLTGSCVEMASRAGTGIKLDLASVPLREKGMDPYEIMLSESQERMIMVARPGQEDKILNICRKWDLDGCIIGRVTDDELICVELNGKEIATIPIGALTEEAPVYERPSAIPQYLDAIQSLDLDLIQEPKDYSRVLIELLSSPIIASKEWVYRQYDHMVQTNTVLLPGSDAAVLRIKGSQKGLAMTVDGNSCYTVLNPYQGGAIAVCEAARNLICAGAKPIALTNCLNFANPERPDVMWQFAVTIEGMADACRHFEIPVVSGNVSFYNETEDIGIYPTPVIGMVGLIDDIKKVTSSWFKDEGDLIVLLGKSQEELGGSEYLRVVHSREGGIPPALTLSSESAVQSCCLTAIEAGIIKSAHDCSEGGLAVAIAESCVNSPYDGTVGAKINFETRHIRTDALMFGESQSRIIVSVEVSRLGELEQIAASRHVAMEVIGRVEGNRLIISESERMLVDLSVKDIQKAWKKSMPDQMSGNIHV